MKFYTPEEADQLVILKSKRHTRVVLGLARLKVNEAMLIERGTDWVTKHTPWRVVNAFVRKRGWKVEKGIDPEGKGWLVKRLA
ncbi:MAG: hypothetical protein KIS94_16090 [Chitinophagales bacterium]|nr:hypothetical protein [Chitinophagales bacterium]MCW5909386.1 hypothetical protein [Chitinophagales bacterium]